MDFSLGFPPRLLTDGTTVLRKPTQLFVITLGLGCMCWPTFYIYIYIYTQKKLDKVLDLTSLWCICFSLLPCTAAFLYIYNFWYFHEIAALWKCKLEPQSFKPAEFHKSWAFVSTSSGKSFSLCVFFFFLRASTTEAWGSLACGSQPRHKLKLPLLILSLGKVLSLTKTPCRTLQRDDFQKKWNFTT